MQAPQRMHFSEYQKSVHSKPLGTTVVHKDEMHFTVPSRGATEVRGVAA